MRPKFPALTLACAALFAGCTQQPDDLPTAEALGAVLGITTSAEEASSDASPDTAAQSETRTLDEEDLPGPRYDALRVRGAVRAVGEYRLFDLGAADAGDEWVVTDEGGTRGAFVVVLFDAGFNLLRRSYVGAQAALRHVVREATPHVYIGVMTPALGGGGGEFDFLATRQAGQVIPPPNRQVVWLNFAGGRGVLVHRSPPLEFDAFHGAVIDEAYAGQTEELKAAIVDVVRADYAPFDVTILTSDESPRPSDPHSVVHFGGAEGGLLGLADSVDAYNREPAQTAVIYVGSFAPYRNMGLSAAQMGVMIGNVASHELGHLLGLYHTKDPADVMDTTGTAWQLADTQTFARAPLEESVFAVGLADSPMLLAHGVGLNPTPMAAKASAARRLSAIPRLAAIRRASAIALRHGCGTCAHLDEPDDSLSR